MKVGWIRSARVAPPALALPALLLALALAAPSSASAAPRSASAAPSHRLDPSAAAGFWTPARVRAALAASSAPARFRLFAPPWLQKLGNVRGEGASGGGATASSLRVLESTAPADRTNGRIFGIDPRQGPYTCSGTSLATPSESIVLTAGHCVLDEGSWGTHLAFVPAYDHEQRPFGSFPVTASYVTEQWRASENTDFDVAALRVEPNRFGTLAAAVGAKGWTTGRSRFAPFEVFGYPAAALSGEELRSCRAHGLGADALTNRLGGPPTVPVACDMAGGASGGAWLVDGGRLIDGVTSYGYTGNNTRLYSPYFGSQVDAFLRQLP
jgi:V8-like Glu-specific endopeptidase